MPQPLQPQGRPDRKLDGTPPGTRAEKAVFSLTILISLMAFAAWFASSAYSWDIRSWLNGEKTAVKDSPAGVDIARLLP